MFSPNFLEIFYRRHIKLQRQIYLGGVFFFCAVLLLIFLPSQWFFKFGAIFAVVFIFLAFLSRLEFGLHILAAVSFFYGWEIVLARYSWAKNITYLSSINAPLMDFVGVILLFSILVSFITRRYFIDLRRLGHLFFPMVLFTLFTLFACISVLVAYDHDVVVSARFLARNIVFIFLVYVVATNILLKREELLQRVLIIWFWVGAIVAVFGLSSLFVVSQAGWKRVVPYGIGSFAPLGYNHNLIAEVLIAIIPVATYLLFSQHSKISRQWRIGGWCLMILAELLTLSRAGWISLAVQIFIAAYFYRQQLKALVLKTNRVFLLPLAMLVLAIAVYMAMFLTSNLVASSNISRYRATEIVLFYARYSPLLGYGPGMYVPILSNTEDFVMDYGYPLEAHGFLQKILLEEGTVGLFLFLLLLGYILLYIWRTQKKTAGDDQLLMRFLFCMAAGAIVFQLFNTSYFNGVMWMPIGVALAAAGLVRNRIG